MVEPELPLDGGADSIVVQVGQTVRRDSRSWSPAVLDLLQHVDREGFAEAPRALGFDDQGREVLTYIEGAAGFIPDHSSAQDVCARSGGSTQKYGTLLAPVLEVSCEAQRDDGLPPAGMAGSSTGGSHTPL